MKKIILLMVCFLISLSPVCDAAKWITTSTENGIYSAYDADSIVHYKVAGQGEKHFMTEGLFVIGAWNTQGWENTYRIKMDSNCTFVILELCQYRINAPTQCIKPEYSKSEATPGSNLEKTLYAMKFHNN